MAPETLTKTLPCRCEGESNFIQIALSDQYHCWLNPSLSFWWKQQLHSHMLCNHYILGWNMLKYVEISISPKFVLIWFVISIILFFNIFQAYLEWRSRITVAYFVGGSHHQSVIQGEFLVAWNLHFSWNPSIHIHSTFTISIPFVFIWGKTYGFRRLSICFR